MENRRKAPISGLDPSQDWALPNMRERWPGFWFASVCDCSEIQRYLDASIYESQYIFLGFSLSIDNRRLPLAQNVNFSFVSFFYSIV